MSAMGRDKRIYRFVQDTRYGRKVIAESPEISDVAQAVTRYVAGRLVERERALADDSNLALRYAHVAQKERRRRGWQRVSPVRVGGDRRRRVVLRRRLVYREALDLKASVSQSR